MHAENLQTAKANLKKVRFAAFTSGIERRALSLDGQS